MKEIVNDGFAKVVKPYMDAQDKKSREIIAPVEVSPAEAAHSAGDQIIFNGILYDVIAPIAINDALSTSGAGANISAADNIEAQIKATKSQIQTAAAQAAAQNKNTQEMIAPVEEDETDASRAYAIGDQLILDGVLYNVIDAIAQHGIITSEGAGANIEEADDVTDQLSSLNGALSNLDGKAYKTDDAAITEVASDDLLPIYDTSAAAKKKIAVNNFIGGLVSNPNLLDNPWFTVNQRGQSVYGDKTGTDDSHLYTVDRWICRKGQVEIQSNGALKVFCNANTSAITNHAQLNQSLANKEFLIGKEVTFSIKIEDVNLSSTAYINMQFAGSSVNFGFSNYTQSKKATPEAGIHSFTFTIPNDFDAEHMNIGYHIVYDNVADVSNEHYAVVSAMKLELGSISTLAMDTAPNYAEELLKCQRYFYRLKASTPYTYLMVADIYANAKTMYSIFKYPTTMRATPTKTMSGTFNVKNLNTQTFLGSDILQIGSQSFMGDREVLSIVTTNDHFTTDMRVSLGAQNDADAYIDFSADL